MHACKRSNPTGRDGQLRSGIRACGPTLQRQQTNDDLQTIHEPMLELLGQYVLAPQEVGLLTKPCLFPCMSRLQFGGQRIMPRLLARISLEPRAPTETEIRFLGLIWSRSSFPLHALMRLKKNSLGRYSTGL